LHRLVRGVAAEHPLAPGVVGAVEPVQQDLQTRMAVHGDAQHLALHPPVEAFHHAVRARRVRAGLAVRHTVPPTGVLEGVGREAGSAVGQHVRDVEGQGGERLPQEGHGRGGGLVILDRQMHEAGGAVDGDVEVALAGHALAVAQLRQVLHVEMHKADLVLLEDAMRFAGAISGRQAVETLGLEDAVDRISVQVRQEVGDHKGEVVQREACRAAKRTDDGPFLLARLPGQRVRASRAILAVGGAALAPLADGLRGHPVAPGQDAGALVGAGDLGADSRGGASVGVNGKHQRTLRVQDRRREPSKRQACSSIAQPT
jgi:hypothetical protein